MSALGLRSCFKTYPLHSGVTFYDTVNGYYCLVQPYLANNTHIYFLSGAGMLSALLS